MAAAKSDVASAECSFRATERDFCKLQTCRGSHMSQPPSLTSVWRLLTLARVSGIGLDGCAGPRASGCSVGRGRGLCDGRCCAASCTAATVAKPNGAHSVRPAGRTPSHRHLITPVRARLCSLLCVPPHSIARTLALTSSVK